MASAGGCTKNPMKLPTTVQRFKKNSVVAVETFISTASTIAETQPDGWTLVGNKGGYVAQHEHTILSTGGERVILTENNYHIAV